MDTNLNDIYAEDAKVPVGKNALAQLEGLASDQTKLEDNVADLEAKLLRAREVLRTMRESTLPTLLAELNLDGFKTSSGLTISIDSSLRCGISKEREPIAHGWLEDHHAGKLIKRKFEIEFGKDEEAWANKFERDLRQRKKPLKVKRTKKVHPSTLKSYVAEQLEAGVDIPTETFSIFVQTFSVVTRE